MQVSYCSVDCQRADWKLHKVTCKLAGKLQTVIGLLTHHVKYNTAMKRYATEACTIKSEGSGSTDEDGRRTVHFRFPDLATIEKFCLGPERAGGLAMSIDYLGKDHVQMHFDMNTEQKTAATRVWALALENHNSYAPATHAAVILSVVYGPAESPLLFSGAAVIPFLPSPPSLDVDKAGEVGEDKGSEIY